MKVVNKIIPYIITVALVLIIRNYFFIPILVNGDSMDPTFADGELLILNRIVYRTKDIERFDIIVFDYTEDKPLVKRIVGLPGEKVEYKDSNLYINDKLVEEGFIRTNTIDFIISELDEEVVPDGYYFVVGDNRNNSTDSRSIGFVKKNKIMGKVNAILYPISKFEIIK